MMYEASRAHLFTCAGSPLKKTHWCHEAQDRREIRLVPSTASVPNREEQLTDQHGIPVAQRLVLGT
jgi:hypothetical protein